MSTLLLLLARLIRIQRIIPTRSEDEPDVHSTSSSCPSHPHPKNHTNTIGGRARCPLYFFFLPVSSASKESYQHDRRTSPMSTLLLLLARLIRIQRIIPTRSEDEPDVHSTSS